MQRWGFARFNAEQERWFERRLPERLRPQPGRFDYPLPLGRHTHLIVARNTVFFDRTRASHIVLPIIPR
jgi:hypothetical protein